MANASACRTGHDDQRSRCHPGSRVRCAGLRPPLTPGDSQNTTESTHSELRRGVKVELSAYRLRNWAGVRSPMRETKAASVAKLGWASPETAMNSTFSRHAACVCQLETGHGCRPAARSSAARPDRRRRRRPRRWRSGRERRWGERGIHQMAQGELEGAGLSLPVGVHRQQLQAPMKRFEARHADLPAFFGPPITGERPSVA